MPGPGPRTGHDLLGMHRPFRSTGAAGGVDQCGEALGILDVEQRHLGESGTLVHQFGERSNSNAGPVDTLARGRQRAGVGIDSVVVVEYDHCADRPAVTGDLHRDGEVVHVGGQDHRLDLVDDGPQLTRGGSGLKWNCDCAHTDGGQFGDHVVDAGETERGHEVARSDAAVVVTQDGRQGSRVGPSLPVGHRVESGEQASGSAAVGVLDRARAASQGGAVGVPGHDLGNHASEVGCQFTSRVGNRPIRLGSPELRIAVVQMLETVSVSDVSIVFAVDGPCAFHGDCSGHASLPSTMHRTTPDHRARTSNIVIKGKYMPVAD